jgi:hypothetical protein
LIVKKELPKRKKTMKSVYILSCLIFIVSITRNETAAVGDDSDVVSDITDNETINESEKHDCKYLRRLLSILIII